jgi:biopolymer transport protein TolR
MARREKRGDEVMAEINITPFTDVVLVLLIIFMIATPFIIKSGIKVNVPAAQNSRHEEEQFLTISIDAHENVFLDDKKVSVDDLRRLVESRVQKQPGVVVRVNGDKSIKYDMVVKVLDATRGAGAARYLLVAEKQNSEKLKPDFGSGE